MNFNSKKITIMGLGLHGGGLAASKWFLKQGAIITVTDLKTEEQLSASVNDLYSFAKTIKAENNLVFRLGEHREKDFLLADMILKNPGVPRKSKWLKIATDNKISIHNEASLFFLLCKVPIIGITGSKGKSTTTALIGEIFKKNFPNTIIAGNIKTTPMFSIIDQVGENSKVPYVILELSSWQLELIDQAKRSPETCVITNIKEEHLNTYDSIEDYAQAKFLIFKYQKPADKLVLNYDDSRLQKVGEDLDREITWFSLRVSQINGVYYKDSSVYWDDEKVIDRKDIPLLGDHNIMNVMAAIAVAKLYNIEKKQIIDSIKNFTGLHARQEFIGEFNGRKFYNDTTATAPVAAVASLNSFSEKVVLIAGGTDKDLPVEEFAEFIKKKVKKLVLLPGNGTDKLKNKLEKINFENYLDVDSMTKAVEMAYENSEAGDVIILSPGFASFGLFVHEYDRGEKFVQEFNKLKNG